MTTYQFTNRLLIILTRHKYGQFLYFSLSNAFFICTNHNAKKLFHSIALTKEDTNLCTRLKRAPEKSKTVDAFKKHRRRLIQQGRCRNLLYSFRCNGNKKAHPPKAQKLSEDGSNRTVSHRQVCISSMRSIAYHQHGVLYIIKSQKIHAKA